MSTKTILIISIVSAVAFLFMLMRNVFLVPGTNKVPVRFMVGGAPLELTARITMLEKARGLSGMAGLPENHGMLFVYASSGRPGFWMKDMHFPIDIIWLSADFTIVNITPSISPDSFPRVFRPKEPAQYVLEVNAGFAERHGVSVGTLLAPVY